MAAAAGSSTTGRPGQPADAGDAAFRELLASGSKGGMNLAALSARAKDVQRSLDHIQHALQYNPQSIAWTDALDKFAVLNVQYQQLVAQLRPLAKHYVVHPKVVDQDMARVLPIMLATKLLPEMDARNAEHLEASRAAAGGASLQEQYSGLLSATERFNAGIDGLMAANGSGGSGVLDPHGPMRKAVIAAGRPQGAVGGGAAALRRPGAAKVMSRKRKAPEEEALLAAVLRGEGLRR